MTEIPDFASMTMEERRLRLESFVNTSHELQVLRVVRGIKKWSDEEFFLVALLYQLEIQKTLMEISKNFVQKELDK